DKLTAGDYKGAIADLSKVTGKDKPAAKLLVFEADVATGDLAAAEAAVAPLTTDKDAKVASAARVDLSRLHRATGKLDDARKDVEGLVQKDPSNLAARWALALALQDTGQGKKAKDVWDSILKDFDAQKINTDDADQLFYLAEAARYTADFQFANDSYRE